MARAPKDAIVLCLDVGPGMQQAPPGTDTPLDASIKIIKMLIQRKIFSESKDAVALVLFGTEDTLNNLDDGKDYQNINVLHPLCIPEFDLLEMVAEIKPGPERTDFVDAITVSLDILHTQTQGKKIGYRKLVLFTNFDHRFSDDSIEEVIGGFKCENEEVMLIVISPPFEELLSENDDEDSGSDGEGPSTKIRKRDNRETLTEKPKTPQQRAGERLISHILSEGVEGCLFSYDQAAIVLVGFEKKSIRSASWKCDLTLGSDLTIRCAAFAKTKASSLKKSWTKCHANTGKAEDIIQQKYYVLQEDPQTEVDEENICKGYKYGKDVIPFSKEDEEQMKYKTESKCLAILGFTASCNISVQDLMDEQAQYVIAEKDDKAANDALSSLIAALHNLNMCAVARYVFRKGTNPKLVALIPRIRESYQCLVMVGLPFAEDVRNLNFPGLESKQNPAPSENQLSAIDHLIDSMDLCKGKTELFRPSEMVNPYYQWVYHNLSHRALNPKASMPSFDERIKNLLTPKQEIVDRSRPAAEQVRKCFVLEKQEDKRKKTTAAETWANIDLEETDTELDNKAGGDATSDATTLSQIFRSPAVTSVGSVNPEQDFVELLRNATGEEIIKRIFEQMEQRVFEFVIDTFNPGCNKKVLPCLRLMRQRATEVNQIELFNSFLHKLKSMLLADKMKIGYWEEMVSANISLVECEGVNSNDCKAFLAQTVQKEEAAGDTAASTEEEDADDLLDEL